MTHETDGVGEAIEELLRSGLAAAAALARAHAHARAEQLRAAADASEQSTRQLRATLEIERAAARARLATVTQTEWWDRATPHEIAAAWETAQEWRDTDPEAARASVRIRAELEDRYGIDPQDSTPSKAAAAGVEELPEVTNGRRLAAISHKQSVAELLARGGPGSPPLARRARARAGKRLQRDRGR